MGLPNSSEFKDIIGTQRGFDSRKHRLPTGVETLDDLTGGGFPLGSVTEWGMPLGHGGLELLVRLVGRYTKGPDPMWTLVSQAAGGLLVMASSWQSRGVDLNRLRLTVTDYPVRDLKPVLMQPFFKLIVLYAPPKLSSDDCAFLARTARAHNRLVWIVRDGWLTPERGNVWARYRINVRRPIKNAFPNKLNIELVRGLAPRATTLTLSS